MHTSLQCKTLVLLQKSTLATDINVAGRQACYMQSKFLICMSVWFISCLFKYFNVLCKLALMYIGIRSFWRIENVRWRIKYVFCVIWIIYLNLTPSFILQQIKNRYIPSFDWPTCVWKYTYTSYWVLNIQILDYQLQHNHHHLSIMSRLPIKLWYPGTAFLLHFLHFERSLTSIGIIVLRHILICMQHNIRFFTFWRIYMIFRSLVNLLQS